MGSDPEGVAARRAAFRAVRRVEADGAWSPPAVAAELRRGDLDVRDRRFAANLAYETLRWRGTLDWALAQVVRRPLDDVEPAVLDALRLGAWQLLRSDTPARAVVTTSVDLARAEIGDRVTGFVNGTLRALARHVAGGDLPWPGGDEGVALRLGHPTWMVAEARARIGPRAEAFLEASNHPPGLTLRATGDRDALLAELAAAGVDATPGSRAPEAVRAPGADPTRLAAVAEGRAVPQDEASMLVARAVAAGVGDVAGLPVLDACAGPGGKTTHLAQLGAWVAAADVRPARARLVVQAAARAGVAERVAVAVTDGTVPAWRPGSFAAVLVDAPCSGLGVTRRRPEVRWRRSPADVSRLADLQARLLDATAGAVEPGGCLVYSACTWTRAETVDVARAFLALDDRFAAEPLDELGTAALAGDPGVQLGPDEDLDGMYLARFRRLA